MYINNPGHMTKMAAMPIHGKNPSIYRVPTVREKSGKNQKSSRSGKSQGILFLVGEI